MIKAKRPEAAAHRAWGGGGEGAPLAKAKDRAVSSSVRPQLARTELLDKEEIDGALKRRPTSEAKLAGAVRAVCSLSPALRASLGEATSVLLRRGTRQRELYACGLRALAEAQDRQSVGLLRQALGGDEAGGPAALSAACFSRDAELLPLLAKVAASRQSHLAFGAELARVARGESNGALLAQLAPMIKESHRISMCVELFVPLVRGLPVAVHVGPALSVLRGAERHLVAWALSETDAAGRSVPPPPPPTTRPTLELIARLSDRPSADRDTTFLFRMARAGSVAARPMLETLVRALPLADETAIRAALYLARDHGREELREALVDAAVTAKREELRGMAAAALWDASPPAGGEPALHLRTKARDLADELVTSRVLGNVAWGALIRAAAKGGAGAGVEPVLTETPFRWIQWGWLE